MAVNELADRVEREFGKVDILVNSAGSAFRSPAEDFPEDKLDFILAPQSPRGLTLAARPSDGKMLSQGKGSVINIASIGSLPSPIRGQAPISPRKAAYFSLPRPWR